jgi:hypothetical protein
VREKAKIRQLQLELLEKDQTVEKRRELQASLANRSVLLRLERQRIKHQEIQQFI